MRCFVATQIPSVQLSDKIHSLSYVQQHNITVAASVPSPPSRGNLNTTLDSEVLFLSDSGDGTPKSCLDCCVCVCGDEGVVCVQSVKLQRC
jgi:hypothetical protein